jgi:signal transduction histidine kinase
MSNGHMQQHTMADKADSHQLASRLRWIPQVASASAVLVGCLVLVGWWFDVEILKTPASEYPAMKANTALAFVLTGLSLWLLQAESHSRWGEPVAQVCVWTVALISLLTLSEYLFGWDMAIDRMLIRRFHAPVEPYDTPGRTAFASALNFLLLGGAFLLMDVKTRRGYEYAVPFLAALVGVSAFLTLVAHLYGATALHQAYGFATVAPHSAVLFVALSIGVLFARPQHGIMGIMASGTVAAVAMRRLMLLTVALPVSLGWVALIGQEQYDLYGMEFGMALIVVAAVVGLTVSVYWHAKSLIQAEEYQRGINEVSVALSGSITLEETLPVFAVIIKKIVSSDRICVMVRKEEGLVAVLSSSDDPRLRCCHGKVWRSSGETAVEWVITHKTPRLIQDLTLEQSFADEAFVAREGIRSTLILPLLVGGEAVGSVTLDSMVPDAFTQDHMTILSGFMEPLASAIRNAELHAQVVRHSHDLERLVEARTHELQVANGLLAEASHNKSAFLANMSHELRTPLNCILGFSDLLRDQTGSPLTVKQARYTDHIWTSGRHLLTLINDLLDLSKVEANKLILRPEPFAFSEALAAAVQGIQPLADTKGLTVTLNADLAPAILTADPVRFKQILYNLLSNAVKFTPESGRVTVTARVVLSAGRQEAGGGGEFVEIAVTDTGIGIAAEDLPTLFERFRQLETMEQAQGSGLGLALTKQLVELHGGMITAASAGPGQGSCFTVCLPVAPPASQHLGEG